MNRRYLLVPVIFLLITWVLFITSRERSQEGKIEYFLHTALVPLESLFNQTNRIVSDNWRTVSRLSRLKADNERLRRQMSLLRTKQLRLSAIQAENGRLRAALGFIDAQPHQLVGAEIIALNPTNWNRTFIINKGADAGLRKNMAVISAQGVVGRVAEVRSNTAEIIAITDPRQGNIIGGVVSRTRNMVIVTGGGPQQGMCTVQPAGDSYFIDLKKGDRILTAETSDIFPRGLPIGRVVSVSKQPKKMTYQAYLKPAVNLAHLQLVYIIKVKKDPPLPVQSETVTPSPGATPLPTGKPGGDASAPAHP